MRLDLTRIPPQLIAAVKTGNLIPFIGAGISRQATQKDGSEFPEGKGFPDWAGFLKHLADLAALGEYISDDDLSDIRELIQRGKHLMAAQALKAVIPKDALHRHIQMLFDTEDAEVGEVHLALLRLGAPLIITTNYDGLLEKAYSKEFNTHATVYTYKKSPQVQHLLKSHRHHYTTPAIFKIHGCATEPEDIVFAEMDYRNLIYHQPGYRAVLSAVFVTKVVLMLGFSYSDPELTLVNESLREYFDDRSMPDFIVLEKGERMKVERMRLRSDFGLEVIEYEKPSEILDFVNALVVHAQS